MIPPIGLDAQAVYEALLRVALARRDQAHRPEHLGFVLVGIDPGVAWLLAQIDVNRAALLADLAPIFPSPPPNRLLAMERHGRPGWSQRDAHRPLRTAQRAQRSRP